MGRRSTKTVKRMRMQASSQDDETRAAIIRDAMIRAGLSNGAQEWLSYDQVPEQAPAKRQKLDEAGTAAYAQETTKPARGEQAAMDDRTLYPLHWPVDDFAAQPTTLQEFALSPLETEVVFLREALALSTQREESQLQTCNALRIQLHKAYRMIAIHHLNSFTCDTEAPPFPEPQIAVLTQH